MPGFSAVTIVLFAIWTLLLVVSARTRREQVVMSILGLFLSPGALLFAVHDYRAVGEGAVSFIGVPELLFAFSTFGIAAVLHEMLPHKKTPEKRTGAAHHVSNWIARLMVAAGVWLFISVAGYTVFHLPSVQAFMLGGAILGVYIVADRKDLFREALVSGIFVAMLIFLVEQFFFLRLYPEAAASFWQVDNLSGIILGGIPVEEILWAAIVGFSVGPLYEFVRGTNARHS